MTHASGDTHPLADNNVFSDNQTINVLSDRLDIYYPNTIQFTGNVNIKQNNNTLASDKLIISRNRNNMLSYNTLHAIGHVCYSNNYITLTGDHAWINLNNKNIDIYKGTYYLSGSHIYGKANTIMQRKKNRYTIIKQGKFTSCMVGDNYWNIIGSKIIYDHHKHNVNIWDACLKIKKIPIFYSPYLSLSLHQNNIFLKNYIPNIKYSNQHGFGIKIPCPVNFAKNCSGSISPCYTSDLGIKLETKIHYLIKPGTGVLILDIIGNDIAYKNSLPHDHYYNKYWQLYWKHNGIMNKKWHFISNYSPDIHQNKNYIKNIKVPTYTYSNNKDINQKLLCNYSDKNWNTNLIYLGISENTKTTTIRNHCNYSVAPQLELNTYYNNIINRPLNLKLFNQFTQFLPTNFYFPKAIRIHAEPTLNFAINDYWGNFNTELKLNITHYRQYNIHYYNTTHCKNYHLQNIVNRIIPQFKVNSKIILQKKKYDSKKYKHLLEPRFQYLYVPYRFQENIGTYDTDIIYINHKNLFHDSMYSGLDRIAPANRIIGDITLRYFDKKNELFSASMGQILDLTQQFNSKYSKIIKNKYIYPNIMLFSGTINWNINNYWHMNTEIQYNIRNHTLSFGTAILEHIGKNNQILQAHYRYFNEKYLKQILPNISIPLYHRPISQLGVLAYFPLTKNLRIHCSYSHNVKTNQLINQIIGIQYRNSCWGINIACERKIIDWNDRSNSNIYDNRIRLDIKIYSSIADFKTDPYEILNIGMLPYQYIF